MPAWLKTMSLRLHGKFWGVAYWQGLRGIEAGAYESAFQLLVCKA